MASVKDPLHSMDRRRSLTPPPTMLESASSLPNLNLVLCGSQGDLKASISDLLLGQREQRVESSSSCVILKGEVSGHLITLVEMPALYSTQLSEQEVMLQMFHCVSVCDPGVHAFFIITPVGPLTDEDKSEIEMIQRIFSPRVNEHIIFITNTETEQDLDEATTSLIKSCKGHINVGRTTGPELLNAVMQIVQDSDESCYTTTMYLEAQVMTQLKYKSQLQELMQINANLKKQVENKSQKAALDSQDLRIVLLGKTGVGKSASGNTILGKEIFKEDISDESITSVCQKEMTEVNGRLITVIDTPGLFDTNTDNDETRKEIIKCVSMAAPGPHVFLLVLRVGHRFTQEERETVNLIKETFGEKSNIYTIVLFTRGDELKGKTIDQFIENAGEILKTLVLEFGNRYHVLNNNDKSSNTQVLTLLDKIDSMVKVNGGSCYTNEMFQQVEEALEGEKEKILKEREEQIEREKEDLKTKYEEQMKSMRTEIQKHKERKEAKERIKEEEFKQKEEKIKREISERDEQLREDFRKRREDDELKMKELMQEINREREENRKQWEKEREQDQKRRDQEEEERRKKEQEWKEKQREESEKFKREKEEIRKKEEEELKKLREEYEQKEAEEEKRKRDLEEKIKELRMKKEDEERKRQKIWEEKIAAMEKNWSLDQIWKEKQYELEIQKEKEERDLKEKERKEKEEEEKKIENDYNEKIRKMEEQLKEQREKDERERKEKDEEHKKEMNELQKQQEEFRKEKEEEERKHNEKEQRNLAFIEEQCKKQLENLKRETEKTVRRQAEERFSAKCDENKALDKFIRNMSQKKIKR